MTVHPACPPSIEYVKAFAAAIAKDHVTEEAREDACSEDGYTSHMGWTIWYDAATDTVSAHDYLKSGRRVKVAVPR